MIWGIMLATAAAFAMFSLRRKARVRRCLNVAAAEWERWEYSKHRRTYSMQAVDGVLLAFKSDKLEAYAWINSMHRMQCMESGE